MSMKKVTAFAIFWQFFHSSSCSLAYLKYANIKAINWGQPLAGHRLNATPIATSKVSNRIKCMAECGKTQGCVAINLGPNQAGEHECEFLSTTRYGVSFVNITAEAGWTYTGPKTKCDTNPCSSDFSCIARETTNDHICLDLSKVATCQEYRDLGFTKSGIYTLALRSGQQIKAYCDLEDEGRGWIVFIRNNNQDTEIFNRDYTTYQNGFGDLNSWWGNEFLHLVTKDTPQEFKVDLVKPSASGYVKYTGFQIADKDDGYRLSIDVNSYSGNGGAHLSRHNAMMFSTPDKDQDVGSPNCAAERRAGWWFRYCAYCVATKVPIHWGTWNPTFIQLKIRPMNV